MSDLITYDDKIRLKSQNVSDKYKVTAEDMNEIKEVVNTNVEIVDEINNPENWVSVGTTAPTDGRRVWFEYSRNILPENLYMATRTLNGITYTNNGNGTISFSGTATANTSLQIIPDSKMSFKAGQPYYLYSSVPYNSTTFNLSIALTENGATRYLLANGTYTPTYNSTQARLSLYIPNGTTISATNVKLMLVEGNTAPSEYEPYVEEKTINIDNSTLIGQDNLVSVGINQPGGGKRVWFAKGKNLFDKNTQLYKSNSYIDGSGQEGTNSEWSIFRTNLEPNTTYTLTNSGASGTPGYVLYNSSGVRVDGSNYSNRSHITFTTTNDTSYMLESVVANTSSGRYDLDIFQIEQGSTATSYEAYISPTINVDGEEWYNKSFAIKTKVYPSVTTASTGYYNLNLKCNEVAIIGYTHDPIASATRLQLYSNEQGWWFIRCSINDGVYGERTITNLKIYYI